MYFKHLLLFGTISQLILAPNAPAHINYKVPPKIAPFDFARDVNFGERASVQCVVGTGDLPLTFTWTKDDIPIVTSNIVTGNSVDAETQKRIENLIKSITIRQNDEFSSVLSITKVTRIHDGNYTCSVENEADTVTYSTLLRVNGNS